MNEADEARFKAMSPQELRDAEWDFGPDPKARESGERWIRDGFPHEAIDTYADLDPEMQAKVRTTCRRLKEFYDAQQKFRAIERQTGDRDPKTLPRPLVVLWLNRFDAYSATRARLAAAIKEQRGEVAFFNGLVSLGTEVPDGEYR